MDKENILEVKDLHVDIHMTEGLLTAVRGVNFEMKKGETLGLVGESGCGKSLTCKAILGINDRKCVPSGQILFDSEGLGQVDLLSLDQRGKEIRSIRGKEISMIFQEPMVAFSPMYTIGNQINEATRLHITKDKKRSKEISMEVMRKVGIANVEKRYNQYPHEFSGGIRRRGLLLRVPQPPDKRAPRMTACLRVQHVHSSLVFFFIGEGRVQKGFHNVQRQVFTDHAAAHGQHIGIIVQPGHSGGQCV